MQGKEVEIVKASKAANKLTMGNHLAVEQHPIFTSFIRHTQDPPGVNPKGDPHPDAWENQPERTSRQIITHDPLEGFPEGRKERGQSDIYVIIRNRHRSRTN